jgi:hypothetical protein
MYAAAAHEEKEKYVLRLFVKQSEQRGTERQKAKTNSDRSEDTGVLSLPHEIPLATIYRGAGHVFGFRLVPQSALPFAAEQGRYASRAASFCLTSR